MREPREVVNGLIARIASLQDRQGYSEQHWEGSFEDYLQIVRQNPKVTRTAFQRVYDMILSHGKTEYIDNKKKLDPLQLLQRPGLRRQGRHLRARHPAHEAGERLQERRPGLRHREARHPAARPGRLVQVHHRAPAQEGPGGVLARPPRARSTPSLGHRANQPRGPEAPRAHALPDARGAAAPHPARVARRRSSPTCARPRSASPSPTRGDLCPACRYIFNELMTEYNGDWDQGRRARARAPPDPLREGPHRHRHLPAQGREEPGLDRAHRRHQLPQDRRVRLRLRSARLQLRRRVQHRQPRHHRVHRGPQARRGLPLRPARRDARSTRSSPRSSRRPTSTRSSSATPTSPSTRSSRTTSSWRRSATARSRSTSPTSPGSTRR